MTLVFSRPFEELQLLDPIKDPIKVDTLIIGSGYGAAMSALALVMREGYDKKKNTIMVMERGNEFVPGDFPKTISDLPAYISTQGNKEARTGYSDALIDIRVGDNVISVVGSGLGGTSLINAGVAVDPDETILKVLPKPLGDGGAWMNRLSPSLKIIRELLGVQQHRKGNELGKVIALKRLAESIGAGDRHRLADIAVSFDNGRNNVGVQQTKCNDCGNCFTGCNTGSKNTLAMNAWPLLASEFGVDIVTGGTVDYLYQDTPPTADYPWAAAAYSTRDQTAPKSRNLSVVRAKRIILAAGSFGSTEILKRSSLEANALTHRLERRPLALATQNLGRKFSLNGDGIAFGFGQDTSVHAYAKVPSAAFVSPIKERGETPGPTIVSMIELGESTPDSPRQLIEDGTIPQSLARLWAELLSTQAMTRGYIGNKPSAWHQNNPSADPLTISPSLMDHHQVLLAMGKDNADGVLTLSDTYDHLMLSWPKIDATLAGSESRAAQWLDNTLQNAEEKNGFDGGYYLANTFWKPLPDKFNEVFVGASKIGGTHLCNHPLGGCPMGERAEVGVVNAQGKVFSSTAGTDTYEGLYVLDGSIIPGALGINPFMTIAALAHYLALQIDQPAGQCPTSLPDPINPPVALPTKIGQRIDWPVPALSFTFRERLFWVPLPDHSNDHEILSINALLGIPASVTQGSTVVIDIEIDIPDMNRWLENPAQALAALFTVYTNPNAHQIIDTVNDGDLQVLVREATGSVRLFARDEPSISCWVTTWRACLALWRFFILRREDIITGLTGTGTQAAPANLFRRIARIGSNLLGIWRTAKQHSQWRYLVYTVDTIINGKPIKISGEKRLAYNGSQDRTVRDISNPWTTLTNIELTFVHSVSTRKVEQATGWFRVDLVRMAKQINALQLTSKAETPQVVVGVASLGALALRTIIQTHMWSFGAPTYQKFPTLDAAKNAEFNGQETPKTVEFLRSDNNRVTFKVEETRPVDLTNKEEYWRLLKVIPDKPSEKLPVLLIHGISHNSRVFHTNKLDRNLAGYLANEGHEVWLLDHGLSTSLPPLNGNGNYYPFIDDISEHISKAVNFVQQATGVRKILVFAHCIGAAGLTMSLLKDGNECASKIERLIMHAVPPWIHASESNLLRAYLGVFFRRRFPKEINSIPPSGNVGGWDTLIDRIGSSLPWTEAEFHDHDASEKYPQYARTICNRMTLFYGYEWKHLNLSKEMHEYFPFLFGKSNSNAYRQLYFLVNRGRVTDKDGKNLFVRQESLEKYWRFPTMFLHGRQNEAFNVESSCLSAHQLLSLANDRLVKKPAAPLQTIEFCPIENYGHLDVLIGKDAWRDVFPHISSFFSEKSPEPQNQVSEMPKTNWRAPSNVMTGPIISRPKRIDDDTLSLRIWAETNEFQTSPVVDINFENATVVWIRGRKTSLNGFGQNALKNSMFWLGDLTCQTGKGALGLGLVIGAPNLVDLPIKLKPFLRPNDVLKTLVTSDLSPDTVSKEERPSKTDENIKDGSTINLQMNWAGVYWYERVLSGKFDDRISFVVGSCWYPGSWFDHEVTDRVFADIKQQVIADDGVDHLLLVGDQIYADASYAIFDIAENRERYQESYRRAFQSPQARWVLQHIPTYFAVDDHEFRDNYPSPFAGDAPDELVTLGISAAQEAWNFQMHHQNTPPPTGNARPLDNQLWYSFTSAGFDFFVFDTRSERNFVSANNQIGCLLSPAQQGGFDQWVQTLDIGETKKPIFLVTGSPFVPVPLDEIKPSAKATNSDSLRAYPIFFEYVSTTLITHKISRPLILLSGDPHYSALSVFAVNDAGGNNELLRCVAVVSSGMSVPLPFANDRADDAYSIQSPTKVMDQCPYDFKPHNSRVTFKISSSSLLSNSRAHALRIDVRKDDKQKWQLTATVIDADSHSVPTTKTVSI